MIRSQLAVQLAVLFLTSVAWTNPVISCDDSPTTAAATFENNNTTDSPSQINILGRRGVADTLAPRQATCPNPSTNSLCPSNFCFIYQQNSDGTAWATCCPAGWSLSLDKVAWTKQRCIASGISEAPLRPVSCGGSINGEPGIFSGWACVYANRLVSSVGTAKWSILLVTAIGLSWFGMWLS